MKNVECIIMDWAGTAIDFGCFAPVNAFIEAFHETGINVTIEEVRKPMGKAKIEHIRTMMEMPSINNQFTRLHHRPWNHEDIILLNRKFEKLLFDTLEDYTDPIPGVLETIDILRNNDIKIGSTTGYTRAMMNIVLPAAEQKRYKVDNSVTSDEVPCGRPAPYMIFRNMIDLSIDNLDKVVKVGDTIEDIKEGLQAKAWTVGIIRGSSDLGLSYNEINTIPADELKDKIEKVRSRMLGAGAHYVIDSMEELPAIINKINKEINK